MALSRRRRLVYIGLLYLCLLGVLEVGFRLAAAVSPRWALMLSPGIAMTISDPALGTRPNPEAPDHDAAGWRNAEIREPVSVIAIGDSQTYGHTVSRSNAWPQRLEQMTGLPVYNMALGGYNPVQYLALIEEALELSPRVILVGIYSGNDLAGSYSAVYAEGLGAELRSTDPEVLRAIEHRNASTPPVHDAWLRTQTSRRSTWKRWSDTLLYPVRAYSTVWGLARAASKWGRSGPGRMKQDLVRTRWADYHAVAVQADPAILFPVDTGNARTVFTPSSWLMTMDQSDPRVAEGARITLDAIGRMQAACQRRCEVVPVFIPTKELAFAEAVPRGIGPPELDELRRWETQWWARAVGYLRERGMRWVDTLPRLRRSIARGDSPFYMDWNSHLNVIGNELVAQAVTASKPLQDLVDHSRPERR